MRLESRDSGVNSQSPCGSSTHETKTRSCLKKQEPLESLAGWELGVRTPTPTQDF